VEIGLLGHERRANRFQFSNATKTDSMFDPVLTVSIDAHPIYRKAHQMYSNPSLEVGFLGHDKGQAHSLQDLDLSRLDKHWLSDGEILLVVLFSHLVLLHCQYVSKSNHTTYLEEPLWGLVPWSRLASTIRIRGSMYQFSTQLRVPGEAGS
jgi:hypothetical protein